ncbi:GlxA family transcriptional regulator [Leifsonia naganoensis]|uniref:Transcriptional regulator GlxA family with amidase domain n=1 Tax=Leifsonia naganoensis TaxID=150025 RepID=A0A853DRA7_9MICO|nr:helix-turn-helix domain-containing protein [Leifsonia naganoensis]NYK10163.1 transcriptional regulator GlxA family with amidase domain [Leifsonia naganoensis]
MDRDRHLAAVIVPDTALLFETAVPISVFGVDRTATGAPPLRVVAVSEADTSATTGGLSLTGLSGLGAADDAGVVIVPNWPDPESRPSDALVAVLKRAVDDGATVMGLCSGAYALAYAGILDGHRAITHWRWVHDFANRFPNTVVDDSGLYVDEGNIITSAGTAAGLDACLHYVRREWGSAAANAIARRMVTAPHRHGSQNQFAQPEPLRSASPTIAAIQERVIANLPRALTVDDLARWYGTSRRTLDRDFTATVGQSAMQWILRQRVLTAQELLETTTLTVEQVAHRTGFSSATALRPAFRNALGISPQQYRQAFAPFED